MNKKMLVFLSVMSVGLGATDAAGSSSLQKVLDSKELYLPGVQISLELLSSDPAALVPLVGFSFPSHPDKVELTYCCGITDGGRDITVEQKIHFGLSKDEEGVVLCYGFFNIDSKQGGRSVLQHLFSYKSCYSNSGSCDVSTNISVGKKPYLNEGVLLLGRGFSLKFHIRDHVSEGVLFSESY